MQLSFAPSLYNQQESTSGRLSSLSIADAFIGDSPRIDVLSGNGRPTEVPKLWRPILSDSDILVIVPDMHMFIYTSMLDNFKYGAEAMLSFLRHAESYRSRAEREGYRMRFCQLGDMFELCYPHPDLSRPVSVRDIRRSHPIYEEIVRYFHKLQFSHVIGNHDVSYLLKRGGLPWLRDGSVHLEHGNAADHWSSFTKPEATLWDASMRAFRTFRRWEARSHRWRQQLGLGNRRQRGPIGIQSGMNEQAHLPPSRHYPARQLRYYRDMMHETADPFRVCVIAHTHYPYLNPVFANGNGMFVDAGAWTEGRSDFVVITNREIAVCRYRRADRRPVAVSLRQAG